MKRDSMPTMKFFACRGYLVLPFVLIFLLLFAITAQAASLTLPSSLKEISDEAFMGDSALESVVLPDGIEQIGDRAFADSSLVEIYLPNSLEAISDSAFDNHIPALIIKGYSGSTAESYAQAHDIMFIALDNEPSVVITTSWDEFADASSEMIQEYGASVSISSSDSKYPTGRLIVKTNDDLPDVSQFHVAGIIRDPENHYLLQFLSDTDADDCANYLANISDIIYVEPDAYTNGNSNMGVEGIEVQSNSWGVAATYADEYAADLAARGITSKIVVAVVDTGVDSTHSMLRGRIVSGYDFIDNDTTPQDGHGHGTHVSGTIVDCTPGLNVNIMPVRVLGNNGSGSFSCVAQGIRYAARSGASVINLSLGGGHSSYVDEAVEFALNKGSIVVVAAGNESDNTSNHCPAHIAGCITVAAVNSSKQKASFSNYGSAVDIAAPGVSIKSSVPGGGYETWDGTSMATPHVSAAAAMLILDHYSNIESQLRNAAEDLGATGWDRYYGSGFLCLRPFIKGQNVYTITYDANGGSGAPEAQTKNEGKTIALSTAKPTRIHIVSFNDNAGNTSARTANCTFLRWNTKSDGSGTNYTSGASYSADESVTMFAQWSFPAIGTLPQPTREGYTFDGWYSSPTGGTKITSSTTVSGDVTYYAHWTKLVTYTISYNANGGTGVPSEQTKLQGTSLTLSSTKPSRSNTVTMNYGTGTTGTRSVSATFSSWNTSVDGTGTKYMSGGEYTEDASVTLYAQWNFGVIGDLPEVTRDGYDLDGWFTAASGGTRITASTPVTGNITIYAQWTETPVIKPVESLTISSSSDTIAAGDKLQITVDSIEPDDATDKSYSWEITSLGGAATITKSGVLTGVTPGLVQIRAVADDGFGAVSNEIEIEIVTKVILSETNGIDISSGDVTLANMQTGGGLSLKATVKPASTSQSIVWQCESADNAVTVSQSGEVKLASTISKTSTATVTATAADGSFATLKLTLVPFDAKLVPAGHAYAPEGTMMITKYRATDDMVTIPQTIKGITVTAIDDKVFKGETIKYVKMQKGLKYIGASAFENCKSLQSVILPSSLSVIGDSAFSLCNVLSAINIPSGVTEIGDYAFYYCYSMTGVTISNTVTKIGKFAFNHCKALTTVTIPASVKRIETAAFQECDKLATVNLSSGLTFMGDSVFLYCTSLTSISIPSGVVSIGSDAFANCSKLKSITIPNTVTSIGLRAFESCTVLTSVTIPSSVKTIDESAFGHCSKLSSVTLANGVTSVGKGAFEYCTALTKIVLPDSVTSLGNSAFDHCSKLSSITLSNNLTSIGSSTFQYCEALSEITIPDSVTSVGSSAFQLCSGLTSITFPNNVKSIGWKACDNCSKLKSITIPTSVTEIGSDAFSACASGKTIYGYTGSYAETYAKENKINFSSIG